MRVTKEDVDKAKADYDAADYAAANGEYEGAAAAAWERYIKLKREFENEQR